MNKVFKVILKILGGIVISILLVLVLLYIFIQTNSFNKWALELTLEKVSPSLQKGNKINAESITGNILTGISLNSGNIVTKQDTLLKFNHIEVDYDLWGLLDHEIRLGHVTLNTPVINLIKSDTTWNFSNIFKASETIDTSTSVFDWAVTVKDLKIENGTMKVFGNAGEQVDMNKAFTKLDSLDFNNLSVKNLEMELSADYFKERKNVKLKNLSFNTNSDFNLKKLMFDALINVKDTTTDLSGLELVTDRSVVKIDRLKLNTLNPLDSVTMTDFGKKDIAADLHIEKLDFKDVKFFIPSLNELDSVIALDLSAEGKIEDMNVKDLKLKLPNSLISLNGNIKNLNEADSLYLDIEVPGLSLDPKDVRLIYNDPSIPDYSHLGLITGDIKYKGNLNDFNTEFNLNTGAGAVNGNVKLNIENEMYAGKIDTRNFNLGKILKDNSLNSNINLTADFSGNGFTPGKMTAGVLYDVSGSSFAGYDIRKSSGKINASGNNIAINASHFSSMGNVLLNGRVNIANMKNPVYVMKGKVSNLNIAALTRSANDRSNLNFTFDINGRGADPKNINGSYNFDIQKSFYADYNIPETPVDLKVNNTGGQSSISLATNMVDFNANGQFNLSDVIRVLQNNIQSVQTAAAKEFNPDSLIEQTTGYAENNYGGSFNFTYGLSVKDTAKLNAVLEPFGISFDGNVKGSASNNAEGFVSKVNLDVARLVYSDTAIILKNVKTDFEFKNNYAVAVEDNLFAPYSFSLVTKGDRIIFNKNSIDSADINLKLDNSALGINVTAKQDTTNSLMLMGSVNLLAGKMSADMDSVKIKYNDYQIENGSRWLVDYFNDGRIDFREFDIKSGGINLSIGGEYAMNGNSDVNIKAESFTPGELFDLINYKRPKGNRLDGNINLTANYKGNFENPEFNLKINSNDLTFKDRKIGTLNIDAGYKGEIASANISLLNEENKGSLSIEGSMPYANPLQADSSSETEFASSPVDVKLTAKQFQMEYFTKLVPSIPDITGVMNGEISTTGVVSAPELKGDLQITEGTAFIDLTGMVYYYNVKLSTANSKLNVETISLSNSDKSKHFDISGSVDFAGMKVNDIDLTTTGDIVLLDKSSETNGLGVQGYLWGGSASNPIKIKGNLKKLDITGQFLIKEATISSIPTKGSGYDIENDNFVYINATPDSDGYIRDSLILENPEDIYKINPFEQSKYKIAVAHDSTSIINLDLNVKTEKNIYISIDFKNLTRDRLFGEITADLNIKSSGKEIDAFGSVVVLKDSYYRFYRNFKISDSKITFDGPIDKPILDIQAIYQGVKNTDQIGGAASYPVEVKLTVKGQIDSPAVAINLSEDGSTVTSSDAQADAITYLLFGKYKSELSTSERKTVASSVGTTIGSLYITSIISSTVREILPFLVDAEFNYTDGGAQNTDVEVTSEFGDLTVKVGGKLLKEVKNFEFSADYPINKLLNLDLPESLIMQVSRKENSNTGPGGTTGDYLTGVKVAYKIKY